MYRIGDLSKILNVSTRTLRYYTDIGLLEPIYVDSNGYRYYNDNNIEEYNKIMLYKSLGFSLDEILQYKDNLNEEILELKKEETQNQINSLEIRLKKIDLMKERLNLGRSLVRVRRKKNE